MTEITVVAAVIERDGRVLITRRPAGVHLAGLWEFPGGKVSPAETLEAAVIREIREELGVEVEVGSLLLSTGHRYEDRHVSLHFFRCRLLRGHEPSPIQVAELRWVAPADLQEQEFPPADRELLAILRG